MTSNLSLRLAPAILLVLCHGTLGAEDEILLFDGTGLNGWQTLDGKPVTQGWEAVDGVLHLTVGGPRGGNIVTDREYRDFDLQFEWKIAEKGNNGLKYRVRKYGNSHLGCEYQILDDTAHSSKIKPRGRTGSLYELYEPNDLHLARPLGEFNHSRIVVRGNHIEHWLNGHQIVSAEVGSSEWFRRVAESKFAKNEGFGQNRDGRIMLTDHNSEVWYRNIVLKPLPPPEEVYVSTVARCKHSRGGIHRLCRALARAPIVKFRPRCVRSRR